MSSTSSPSLPSSKTESPVERRRLVSSLIIGVCLILAALLLPTSAQGEALSTVAPQSTGMGTAEWAMLDLLNAERAKAGVAPLAMQFDAHQYARFHSKRMGEAGTIWHDMTEFGRWIPAGTTAYAENVARNYSVTGAHTSLMNSSGHRANILNSTYGFVGIGLHTTADGSLFVSQNFVGGTGIKAEVVPAPVQATTTTSTATPTTVKPTTTTTAAAATLVAAPSGLQSWRSGNQIGLRWTAPSTRGLRYEIWRRPSTGTTYTWTGTVPGESTRFVDSGLTTTSEWVYGVKAVTTAGAKSSMTYLRVNAAA